ncbi:MAG: minor capsid protein [Myxococcaceae bacterium]|nr:minor capsid protein [Myxococcaceae bacterium]
MAEFVDVVADLLVASGVGGLYEGSTQVQVNFRREQEQAATVLVVQTGGVAFPFDHKEQAAFQVLMDATTISGGQALARQVFELLHEVVATEVGGYQVLWMRAVAPPQLVAWPGDDERHAWSLNFDALIAKA